MERSDTAATVIVFAKEPVPGRVKTRLVPPLTPEEAAAFAAACVRDLSHRLASFPARRVLAIPSDSSPDALRAIVGRDWEIRDQGDGDLGAKLARTTSAEFARGAGPVAVVGSDHPHLPLAWLESALDAARAGDAGWIPAADGGYACLALPRALPELFADVPWSTSGVAEATRNNARRLGVNLATFGPWYDLDAAPDIDRFLAERTSRETCPQTWRMLTALAPPWEERRRGSG